MFNFDPSLLTVEYLAMKAVTTALGGSMTIVTLDENNIEKQERLEVPFAVARKFIKQTTFTKYIKPVTVAALRYDGQIINLERDIASNLRDGDDSLPWVSAIETYVKEYLPKKLANGLPWLFDGRYVYQLPEPVMDQLRVCEGPNVTSLNAAKTFCFTAIQCIDLYYSNETIMPSCGIISEEREVLAYSSRSSSGQVCFAVTPPIWKNVTAIGSSATLSEGENDDYIDTTTGITAGETRIPTLIDSLDVHYSLNLNFTLNSAKNISTIFGFDSIEALQLPEIMLQLLTVNIPSLPKHIKATFAVGLMPSHGLCWLMGLLNKTTNLNDYMTVRTSIKYLTTKGMFIKSSTDTSSMFATEVRTLPPLMNITNEINELRK